VAQIPDEEYLCKTTTACAGCPSSLCLRYVTKAAGPDTVFVIPACCTSVIQGVFPTTAFNFPVYNVAFASAAAVASGMSEAFREIGRQTNVICYAGDGGTVDIGIQALSGALERGTDFLYICYDNEAYSNTGMQRSGATPLGARTTTTPAGKQDFKKDLDAIVAAHNPVYQATACVSYPQDLFNKVQKALSMPGPKFMHILAPCPPGWRFGSDETIEMGKRAVKSGMWVLWERANGEFAVTGASKAAMKKRIPVAEYISGQGRFATITEEQVEELQLQVDRTMEKIQKEVDGIC